MCRYRPQAFAFFFPSALSSHGWQSGCHILNITTISQGLCRERSMMQLNLGDSQALCLFSEPRMSYRLEIRWIMEPWLLSFWWSTMSICQTTAQNQSSDLLSLHSNPELPRPTGESCSLRGWGQWFLVSALSWAIRTARRSLATRRKPSTTLLQSISRQLRPVALNLGIHQLHLESFWKSPCLGIYPRPAASQSLGVGTRSWYIF